MTAEAMKIMADTRLLVLLDHWDVRVVIEVLHDVWGDEWQALSHQARRAVTLDFVQMLDDEEWGSCRDAALEYRDRIFVGNLAKYADLQVGRFCDDDGE